MNFERSSADIWQYKYSCLVLITKLEFSYFYCQSKKKDSIYPSHTDTGGVHNVNEAYM